LKAPRVRKASRRFAQRTHRRAFARSTESLSGGSHCRAGVIVGRLPHVPVVNVPTAVLVPRRKKSLEAGAAECGASNGLLTDVFVRRGVEGQHCRSAGFGKPRCDQLNVTCVRMDSSPAPCQWPASATPQRQPAMATATVILPGTRREATKRRLAARRRDQTLRRLNPV